MRRFGRKSNRYNLGLSMMKSSTQENVFLSHIEQDEWNDIRAYHIESASVWRFIAIFAILALMVVASYAVYIVNKDQHKVVVFEKDSLGNITTLGLATQTFAVDNKIIAHQLASFIFALREAPKDTTLKRRNIDIVHKMIDQKILDQVNQLLINQYLAAKDGHISIEIKRIVPLEGGKSWSIYWSEEGGGRALKRQNWSSIVTFTRLDTVDPAVQIVNPISLFITYLHPVEDVNDASID